MEKDLDLIVKATQVALGKYVKRPQLTEKLLKKPPFRFLHDIITAIIKSTGFFEGLFEERELTSDNVKDKEAKITFLNKVIFVIGKTTGKELLVKPSKIIAGQEPEKTNELLQSLAEALDRHLSSDQAIKFFKENTDDGKKKKGQITIISKIKDDKSARSIKSNKSNSQIIKTKPKENVNHKKELLTKTNAVNQNKIKSKDKFEKNSKDIKGHIVKHSNERDEKLLIKENMEVNLEEPIKLINVLDIQTDNNDNIKLNQSVDWDEKHNILGSDDSAKQIAIDVEQSFVSDSVNPERQQDKKNTILLENSFETLQIQNHSDLITNEEDNKFPQEIDDNSENLNSTASQIMMNDKDNKIIRPTSARPTSSRPGAPKLRDKNESDTPDNDIIVGKLNIISEYAVSEEDEELSIVVDNNDETNVSQHQQENNQRGHLVQQILESQKGFSQVVGKTEIEWQFGSQRARDDVNKDIDQLRINIQALSRIANPLGKLLDHIQEDVEGMRQELLQWIQIYEETSKELSKQKMLNEKSMIPFHSKIKHLDTDISEKHQKIENLKVIVYKNKTRFEKLLANGNIH